MLASRIVWMATGGLWAGRSMLEFADPDYWDPVTALDWSAVWMFSAALIMLAPSALLLGRLAPTARVMITATVVAAGALVAGLANGIEDGLGLNGFGVVYVIGFVVAWLGLAGLAVAFAIDGRLRLAALSGALFLGTALLTMGGGVIILGAFCGVSLAPRWFLATSPAPATDISDSDSGVGR
jgi:hypothetical protein